MLRNLPRLKRCTPLINSRCAGDVSDGKGKNEIAYVLREHKWKRNRMIRDMTQVEKAHIATLNLDVAEGESGEEYKPLLEPGTINLKAMKVAYTSHILAKQTREETEAAWAKINHWQEKLTAAKGSGVGSRVGLLQEMIDEFKLVTITQGDPILVQKLHGDRFVNQIFRLHGVGRGCEGYMHLNVDGDPELEQDCMELSENIWLPQVWGGGKFLGDWHALGDLHNEGSLVQVLESVGLSSKLKGCYYLEATPFVLH